MLSNCPKGLLSLVLTHRWYDETFYGNKRIEYRAITAHWKKRIWDRRETLSSVRYSRGYTSETITFKIVLIDIGPCPIPGWDGIYYRIHSGDLEASS